MILGLTQRVIILDAETSSPVDLPKCGAARYFADPATRTLMVGARDSTSEHAVVWDLKDSATPPAGLVQAAALPPEQCMFAAYNAGFDWRALRLAGIDTPPEKWLDLALLAYALCFAGRLNDVLAQTGLTVRKQADGAALMRKFSKENTPWYGDPEGWSRYQSYCATDVDVETDLLNQVLLPVLGRNEYRPMVAELQRRWLLDRRVNDRGFPVGLDTVAGALKIKAVESRRLKAEMQALTGLPNPNSVAQLRAWLAEQGVETADLQAATVRDLQANPATPAPVREVLTCRLQLGKASVKKFDAFHRMHVKGRLHDGYTTCGASRTGRPASRGVNLANIERPSLKDPATAARLIETGDADLLRAMYPEHPMTVLGSCVRASLKAPPGKCFTVADFKSIESVGLAWLAGCDSILSIFREGRDTYRYLASQRLGKPESAVTKVERTFHKPAFLGFGYGMSGPALVEYAANMGVEISPEDADDLIDLCRTQFPEIPALWRNLQHAASDAMTYPGDTFHAFAVQDIAAGTYRQWPAVSYTYDKRTEFLRCLLPSGRTIFYHRPDMRTAVRTSRRGTQYTSTDLYYYGRDQDNSGAWRFRSTWGGKLVENVTQALCADVQYGALHRIDAVPRFELVGHTYDEPITLTDDGDTGALDELIRLMVTPAPWMNKDFYLAADGYTGVDRYRKD